MPVSDIFRDPNERKLLRLVRASATELADRANFTGSTKSGSELLDLYNAAIADGRFVADLNTKPRTVATKLGLPLSDRSLSDLQKAKGFLPPSGSDQNPVLLVCVVIIVLVEHCGPSRKYVVDNTGKIKV